MSSQFNDQPKSRDQWFRAVSDVPGMLAKVPEHLLSERMCIAAANRDGAALRQVPESLRTRAVCDAALATDPRAIMWVPPHLIDEHMALHVVSRSALALQGVPTHLRTPAVCSLAVSMMRANDIDGQVVGAFPKWIYNSLGNPDSEGYALMRQALTASPDALTQVQEIRGDVLSEELLFASVSRWGYTLVHVPPERRTDAMYIAAVEAHGTMLAHVPPALVTRELCASAVRASVREAWGLAPGESMDGEREARRIRGDMRYTYVEPVLGMVPVEWREEALCQAAIEASPDNAEFVPAWTPHLADALGRRCGEDAFAKWVPDVLRDHFFDAVDDVTTPRSPMPKGMQP